MGSGSEWGEPAAGEAGPRWGVARKRRAYLSCHFKQGWSLAGSGAQRGRYAGRNMNPIFCSFSGTRTNPILIVTSPSSDENPQSGM